MSANDPKRTLCVLEWLFGCVAAPTNAANVKKALANSEPSTHGTKQTSPECI